MVKTREKASCPICDRQATVTSKWVANKYGEKYEYLIFKHDDVTHYFNKADEKRRSFEKGKLENKLIEVINSESFREGVFQIGDVKEALTKDFPQISTNTVRSNLLRLSKRGVLEIREDKRKIFFTNQINKGKLNYTFQSMTILMEDINSDTMFKKHVYQFDVVNDRNWPLYYLHTRVVGDTESAIEKLELNAFDVSKSKEIKIIPIEDNPKEKRILLRLSDPIPLSGSRVIRLEYKWDEPAKLFTFSTGTKMKFFEFKIVGRVKTKLVALMVYPNRNETRNLTENIVEVGDSKQGFTSRIRIVDIEPFSVIQLKWDTV